MRLPTLICILAATCLTRPISEAQTSPYVHDPVIAAGEDGRHYMFSTGIGISVMSTDDFSEWKPEPQVFAQTPTWAVDSVPGYNGHTWAPDIRRVNGMWHLYYSCSTFGKNGSAIGHAVTRNLNPTSPDYGWKDLGAVVVSHRNADNWNAIDPNLIIDASGRAWLTFGSFWDGIQLLELDPADLHTPLSAPVTIARRRPAGGTALDECIIEEGVEAGDNAIEAPFLFRHGGWYYLFVSHDYCCRGERSTYRTVYGRADNPAGPYVDREGRRMDAGGGTPLFGPDEENFGVGHCSVYDIDGRTVFFSHAYVKADGGASHLFMRDISFGPDGWIQ